MSALHISTSDGTMPRGPLPSGSLGFDAIYQEHFRFVWSTLLRLGVPRHAVEDASQETFLVVHRRLCDFEGRGSPRAWLFGIARRVAFRVRRSQDRRLRKVSALRTERRSAVPLDDAVAQRELSTLLLEALDELDDDKRAALTLHVFEEMSGPEVAEVLGLNLDTAYSRIKAGRKALKRVLGERGVETDLAMLVGATRQHTRPGVHAQGRVAALLAVPLSTLFVPAAAGLSWKVMVFAAAVGIVSVAGIAVLRASAEPPAVEPGSAVRAATDEDPTTLRVASHTGGPRSAASVPLLRRADPLVPTHQPARLVKPSLAPDAAAPGEAVPVGLQAEVELIDRATAALRSGDASGALAILVEHAKRFPSGQLADERRAYRAVALCSAGKIPQGRAEAGLAREARPSKALVALLDAACGPPRPP